MTELPDVNCLLYISVDDDRNYRSRVEDLDGQILTVAAPIGKGDLEVPEEGSELSVFWTSIRARYVLPVRMLGQTREQPPRWRLLALAEPARKTRRSFVRGGGGGRAEITPATPDRPRGAETRLSGEIIDISEGGVRCRVPAADLEPGDPVMVRVRLGEQSLLIAGEFLSKRQEPEGPGLHIVVTYHPPEADAQAIRRYVFQWEIGERRRRLDEAC